MPELQEKALNVFAVDRRDVPIAHVWVFASYSGVFIGKGETRGLGWTPFRLQFGPDYDYITLRAEYGNYKLANVNVDAAAGNYVFKFEKVTMPRKDIAISLAVGLFFAVFCAALWFGIRHFAGNNGAAWVFGGLLLLFLMGLVWFKPNETFAGPQRQLVKILSAILVGMLCAFFTGSLQLGGKLPFANDIEIAATGGIAGFVFTFLGWPKKEN